VSELRLDSAQIGADDLGAAVAAYTILLGVEPVVREGRVRRFQLARGAVEIEPGAAGLHAVRFAVADANPLPPAQSVNGVEVRFAPAAEIPPPAAPGGAPVEAIDHVVVRSPDLDRAIAFWRDEMSLRLALDRAFPERGLRLVFFRSGGITLEYAGGHPPPAERDGPDRYHGLSYRLGDLSAHRDRLLRAGFDVSPIRSGMRLGTSVATVRSGTAGVPTLLLQVDGPTA
jgi:catechol 2,3-dioxygenase-like lactoylglutathione lyase family enzyme